MSNTSRKSADKIQFPELGVATHTFDSGAREADEGRWMKAYLCEFEASLGYRVSSGSVKAI